MPEFTQSWAFWFVLGIIIGFAIGFILARFSKASRMEKDVFRDDVPPYETPKEIVEKEKRKIAYLKMRGIIVTKNNPRTD